MLRRGPSSPVRWLVNVFAGTLVVGTLAVVVATQLPDEPASGAAPANVRCAIVGEGAITESGQFIPYEMTFGGLLSDGPIVAVGSVAMGTVPNHAQFKASVLDGLARQHTVVADNGSVYAYFLDQDIAGLTRSEILARHGIELDQDRRSNDMAFSAQLIEMFAGRAIAVQVGPFDGALTWSDPDASGLRPHNIYWSDGALEFALSADRSASAILNLARSLVC